MAAYISVPRDLTKVKSKVAFNLTKRQLICFGTAALIGVPLFFLLRDSGGNSAATLGMMAVMLPAFFLGMYKCVRKSVRSGVRCAWIAIVHRNLECPGILCPSKSIVQKSAMPFLF